MTFYFTDAQVPELAGLTKVQRRIVRRGAYEILCQEQPSARWMGGLFGIGGIFSGFIAIGFAWFFTAYHSFEITLFSGILGGYMGGRVALHFYMIRLRPYLKRYIDGHRNEISMAA